MVYYIRSKFPLSLYFFLIKCYFYVWTYYKPLSHDEVPWHEMWLYLLNSCVPQFSFALIVLDWWDHGRVSKLYLHNFSVSDMVFCCSIFKSLGDNQALAAMQIAFTVSPSTGTKTSCAGKCLVLLTIYSIKIPIYCSNKLPN